jgi:glutaminase
LFDYKTFFFVIPTPLSILPEPIRALIPQWLKQGQDLALQGKLPAYIPQLAAVQPPIIALAIGLKDAPTINHWQGEALGENSLINSESSNGISLDDCRNNSPSPRFPLMSLIKPFLLLYLLQKHGADRVWHLVDAVASDLPFNVIPIAKPPNPMLNCGAIALCSLLVSEVNQGDHGAKNLQNWLSQMMRPYSSDQAQLNYAAAPDLSVDTAMLASVRSVPQRRNLAIAKALEALGIVDDGAAALAIYEEICCFSTDVIGLAQLGKALLATEPMTELVLEVMTNCGMYGYSAAFAQNVGIPAKSAVSGAILGILPHQAAIVCYSPPLDAIGNSVAGLFLLEQVKSYLAKV